MKFLKIILSISAFVLFINEINAQEFYSFIGKSKTNLTNQLGAPGNIQRTNTSTVYQYYNSSTENTIYAVQNSKVYMAVKSIKSYSESTAKSNSSVQILNYLALGFTKQGTESGMIILKKGKRVLSIGYMNNSDGTYSTLVTAY
ncbi:MAG: hypothetical protein V1773_07015 [bacterium]